MNIRPALLMLLAAAAVSTLRADTLRDQLALADGAADVYAQIEIVRRILDTEPRNAQLHERLVNQWLAVRDYDMAEKAILDWKDAPDPLRASVLATVLYYRDNRLADAITLLEEAHGRALENTALTTQLAEYLAFKEDNARIIALLESTPGINENADLLIIRAKARMRSKDFEGTLRDFALAKSADKNDDAVKSFWTTAERLKIAMPEIQKRMDILEKEPGNVSALITRAYWYYYVYSLAYLAHVDAKAAYEAAPDSVAARLVYAKCAVSTTRMTAGDALKNLGVDTERSLPSPEVLEQIRQADEAVAATPKDAKTFVARGLLLNEQAFQYTLGLRDAGAALALDPGNTAARLEKISSLARLKNYDAAVAEFAALQTAKPPAADLATAASQLAATAFGAGRLDLALNHINFAIKEAPSAQYYRQRAAILQRLNRPADAQADLQKAASLDRKKR